MTCVRGQARLVPSARNWLLPMSTVGAKIAKASAQDASLRGLRCLPQRTAAGTKS
jgi:hypothetical protein